MPHPKFTPTFHNAPYPRISPSQPRLSCNGKVVVITGGGRGIGRAIATNFAIAGANVFIIGRNEASLRDTMVELSEQSSSSPTTTKPQFGCQAADTSDQEAVKSAIATAVERFGRIDIMVNNAGYLDAHKPISASDLEDYWRCYEVNVKAGIIVVQEFLKIAEPGATFINVSSGASHISRIHNYSAYSSSKMAFARICEYVQGENQELRVFSIQPGSIETDMAKKARDLTPCDDISRFALKVQYVH